MPITPAQWKRFDRDTVIRTDGTVDRKASAEANRAEAKRLLGAVGQGANSTISTLNAITKAGTIAFAPVFAAFAAANAIQAGVHAIADRFER